MKEQMLPFALSKGEISIARALSKSNGPSIRELSVMLDKSESSISQAVKGLERKGFITTRREGMRKSVDTSFRNYALSLIEMLKAEPYVSWEDLLSNSSIAALFRISASDARLGNSISQVSLWRSIQKLSAHGMLSPDGHAIGDRYLSRFINEYSDHVSRNYLLENLPESATILWRSGYSCLFKIRNATQSAIEKLPTGSVPTAVTKSADYGIRFLTPDSYFYFEPELKELTVEDVILHILLIGPESPTYSAYALLLAFKAGKDMDPELLLKRSQIYGLEERALSLTSYVESHGRRRKWPLPKVEELQEQADLYGIVIN